MTNIKHQILDMVDKSGVKMIPRWKFVLYSSLWVIGLIFTFLLLIFVTSLILFLLSKYGFLYLPLFGLGATFHAIMAIPGLLLSFGIVLVVLVEMLARHYSFTFKKPLLVTVSCVVLCAIVVGYLVSLTSFHRMVRDFARKGGMGEGFAHTYDRPFTFKDERGVTILRGEVVATTSDSFSLQGFDDTITIIYASSSGINTYFPQVNDDVVVFGKIDDAGKFQVVGIRLSPHGPFEEKLIPEHERWRPHRPDMMNPFLNKEQNQNEINSN